MPTPLGAPPRLPQHGGARDPPSQLGAEPVRDQAGEGWGKDPPPCSQHARVTLNPAAPSAGQGAGEGEERSEPSGPQPGAGISPLRPASPPRLCRTGWLSGMANFSGSGPSSCKGLNYC
ncbi:unnamed protein product [Lepidochelys kempii]